MKYLKSIHSNNIHVLDEDNLVGGYYGSDTVDVDGHIIFKEDYIAKMLEYLEWGNIRENHKDPVGIVYDYKSHNPEWNYFVAKIDNLDVMNKVRSGVYKGFSLGIRAEEAGLIRIPLSQIAEDKYNHLPKAVIAKIKKLGYVLRIKDFYISEISITDRPKNTKSKITFHKSEVDQDGIEIPSLEDFIMNEEIEKNDEIAEDINKSDILAESEVIQESEPVVERVETEDEVVDKSDNVEVTLFDAGMELLKSINERIDVLLGFVKGLEEKINKEIVVDNTTEVSKSESVETPTTPIDMDLLKSFIDESINSAVSKLDISSHERMGGINKGDTEAVDVFNVTTMDKGEAYSALASIIAKNIKK